MQTLETKDEEGRERMDAAPASFVASMPAEKTLPSVAFYAIALGVIALDQMVKQWTIAAIPVDGSIPLWAGVFQLTHTQNRGMAFSLLPGQTLLLAAAAIIVSAVIVLTQRRFGAKMPLTLGLALTLPLGGALGNLIDRLRLGYVTDLFDFRLIHFPVFNVADAAITIGIALLMWRTMMIKDTTPEATLSTRDAAPKAQEMQ